MSLTLKLTDPDFDARIVYVGAGNTHHNLYWCVYAAMEGGDIFLAVHHYTGRLGVGRAWVGGQSLGRRTCLRNVNTISEKCVKIPSHAASFTQLKQALESLPDAIFRWL